MLFFKLILKTLFLRPYYFLRTRYPIWRLYNIQGIQKFKNNPPTINKTQRTIIESLRKDGLAITNIRDIHPDGEKLLEEIIAFARGELETTYTPKAKPYWNLLWESGNFPFDIKNPVVRLAFDKRVLAIPNSYLDMWTRCSAITAHKTNVMEEGRTPKQTQKWHRDPDDVRICKLFVYLNDVDENGGPFIYVKGSQNGGRYEHVAPQQTPYSPMRYEKGRIPDKMVFEKIPKSRKILL